MLIIIQILGATSIDYAGQEVLTITPSKLYASQDSSSYVSPEVPNTMPSTATSWPSSLEPDSPGYNQYVLQHSHRVVVAEHREREAAFIEELYNHHYPNGPARSGIDLIREQVSHEEPPEMTRLVYSLLI